MTISDVPYIHSSPNILAPHLCLVNGQGNASWTPPSPCKKDSHYVLYANQPRLRKLAWHSHVTLVTSEFLSPTPSWTAGVTWVCHVFLLDAWLNQAQLDSHDGRTHWEICLARPKISNMFDFIVTASRGEFLPTISPHKWRNGWANRHARQFAQLFPQVCGGLKEGQLYSGGLTQFWVSVYGFCELPFFTVYGLPPRNYCALAGNRNFITWGSVFACLVEVFRFQTWLDLQWSRMSYNDLQWPTMRYIMSYN